MNLSKSRYTRGVQCAKSLWLRTYKKDVLSEPDKNALAKFDTGNKVGELACMLFPNGVKIDFMGSTFIEKCEQTKKLLQNNQEVIYEATFIYEGIVVMVDILQNTKEGFVLNEVKSSTSLKEIYKDDCALQYFVLENLNYKIKQVNLIHINNAYIGEEELEVDKLFMHCDITDEVIAKQKEVKENLEKFKQVLEDSKEEPNMDIGEHCFDPYLCDAYEYCWEKRRGLCQKEDIFSIARLKMSKKIELYKKGIVDLKDIKDFSPFNESQKIQIKASLKKEIKIDKPKIKEFLSTLNYPIYHLDFESFTQAIPEFEGTKPYMQIPFQYSLHIDNKTTLIHKEFLAECGIDPRFSLATSLVRDIPKDVCVLAYNASFEKSIIKNLASLYPSLSEHLLNIEKNIKDLMIPFKDKFYYHYKMQGSYSIKSLIPQMQEAYKSLNLIHNGSEAMESFELMCLMDKEEREAYRKALLEYCKLDTLAMVKILAHLEEVIS
ncbi:DUF2779 domain-containing protein [Helicobacter burdigaliensis]|uniref:DUF2779 domain-containing protein n=1 Tax=Helicobacter burdigaliensis TaxID=2315334 RepID=UPI000EF67A3F|nr:DUF2779 domain-containing protein [Helicobacter burdigaliensis]